MKRGRPKAGAACLLRRPRTRPQLLEEQEQAKVVAWARLQLPAWGLPREALFAIPNGAHLAGDQKRRAMQMVLLKKVGLLPGVADLFLAVPRDGLHGLWLEMKRCAYQFRSQAEARASWRTEQQRFADIMQEQGYAYRLVYGFEHARIAIEDYLRPFAKAAARG